MEKEEDPESPEEPKTSKEVRAEAATVAKEDLIRT